jgi:hypothetical protein
VRAIDRQLAAPAPKEATDMPDQIIDAVMARGLHADACRSHPLVGWFVLQDLPEHPGKLAARLVTEGPTPYILLADTLAELHAQLPPHLMRTERHPAEPLQLVEIWFPA